MTTQQRPDQSDISPRFREITDEVLFGDVWERPILSPRERSIVVVSALTAQYRGDQLKRHIRRALRNGLTQEELAEAMGISPPSIGRWERGLVDVSVKQLLRLSEILKVPPSEFIDGGDGLTDEERDLIAFIRANPVHRKLFLGQMEVLQESPPDVAAE